MSAPRVAVVYVHGLWLTGSESHWLRRRIGRQLAAATYVFPYASMGGVITQHAAALNGFLATLEADTLHLVAHSLGGLVLLDFFERLEAAGGLLAAGKRLPAGRVVLLGSPVQGSRSARRLARMPFGKRLLGVTAHHTLLPDVTRTWSGSRELGVIAGNRALGFGRLLGRFDSPSDGTVLVAETRLPGATDHLTLPVSHTGMNFSGEVAGQAAAFLRDGKFVR